jgi:hypothetical protein
MRFSLSPHQLVAHWVPGVVAIGILFVPDLSTATFDASYLGQFIHTIGAPAAILTVAVAGFAAGQFLDCFRNLFEEFMCKFCKKHAIGWHFIWKLSDRGLIRGFAAQGFMASECSRSGGLRREL